MFIVDKFLNLISFFYFILFLGFLTCLFHKLESFCCPSLHWQCGDYQQAFQSGHLSQTHTTMDVLLIPLGQRGNSSPWWHLVSLMYVSVFWDLDDQMMRLLHVTCPFDPDYCCHYCIFPTRYLLYPPLPLALTFEVCLACRVNANSSCPCRSRIRVNANRSYPSSIGLPLAD